MYEEMKSGRGYSTKAEKGQRRGRGGRGEGGRAGGGGGIGGGSVSI